MTRGGSAPAEPARAPAQAETPSPDAFGERPRARPMDAFPIDSGSRRLIALRDPMGYSAQAVVLAPEAFLLLACFDGTRTVREVQAEALRRLGQLVFADDLRKLLRQMDEHLLLDSPRFRAERDRIEGKFLASPVRPPAHSPGGYPDKPGELRTTLDAMFRGPRGSGAPADRAPHDGIAGILAPHIDFHRGGWCYTWAYRALAESRPPDLVILLGVAHAGSGRHPFTLTLKDYDTPLGRVRTARPVVERLLSLSPDGLRAEEGLHRTEHSLEFQAVFLQHVWGGRHAFEVVPVLCSSFEGVAPGMSSPRSAAAVREFLDALREVVTRPGRRVAVVGGVDLAHVGKRFGDNVDLTPDLLEKIRREDAESLERAEARDAEGFHRSVMRDGNARKVCGLAATYAVLDILPDAAKGKVLQYGQAEDPAGGIVSFAAMEFRVQP